MILAVPARARPFLCLLPVVFILQVAGYGFHLEAYATDGFQQQFAADAEMTAPVIELQLFK